MEDREIPYGYCHCGCGEKTTINPQTHTKYGWVKDQPRKYINGHQNRGRRLAEKSEWWRGGTKNEGKYISIYTPDHPHANGKYVLEHRLVVERILGHYLPVGSVVHHIDGNGKNNAPSNLVVCEDEKYHQLLHRRQEALNNCGNADYLRCRYCKQYDDPKNLLIYKNGVNHRQCRIEQGRRYREEKKQCQDMM